MEVDETMFPGQFHHPRFIGERGGRQQQCLVGENSVRSTGWSTRSLAGGRKGARVIQERAASAARIIGSIVVAAADPSSVYRCASDSMTCVAAQPQGPGCRLVGC